ncbi:hypothetical protein [Streptomyces sp. RPT161]|nr:hypothetical protein [Streptomyces sp. RPT161]
MTSTGCLLSCEEFGSEEVLVQAARVAEHAGFEPLAISEVT